MDKLSYTEWTSISPKYTTFGENILWSYANLQMVGGTISMKSNEFTRVSYMVRSKAFKAYMEKRWEVRDMYELNKEKIKRSNICWYCRKNYSPIELTADHVFPRTSGGNNLMENIIYVCKSCNSSKGKNDLMEWLVSQDYIPEYLAIEQYLKEIYFYSCDKQLNHLNWDEIKKITLPFNVRSLLLFQNSEYLKELLCRLTRGEFGDGSPTH